MKETTALDVLVIKISDKITAYDKIVKSINYFQYIRNSDIITYNKSKAKFDKKGRNSDTRLFGQSSSAFGRTNLYTWYPVSYGGYFNANHFCRLIIAKVFSKIFLKCFM